MELALAQAKKAFDMGEIPIGAVVVKDGKVVAKSVQKVGRLATL